MILTIGGQDVTRYLEESSLSIDDAVGRRTVIGFKLSAAPDLGRPLLTLRKGMPVRITDGSVGDFGGLVEEVDEEIIARRNDGSVAGMRYAVTCQDYRVLADRHFANRVYLPLPQAAPLRFTRNSVAYLDSGYPGFPDQMGTEVAVDAPRRHVFGELDPGYDSALLIEEGTVNLLTNPFFTGTYSSGLASGWVKDGLNPSVSENLDPTYATYGNKSQHVVASSMNSGVRQDRAMVAQTTYVARARVYVVSGRVALNLYTGVGGSISVTTPSGHTGWIELETAPFAAVSASGYVRIVAAGGPAEFYVDCCQLEAKPFGTTFHSGTRAPEAVSFETTGLQLALEGITVDIQFASRRYPEPPLWQTPGRLSTAFRLLRNAAGETAAWLYYDGGASGWQLQVQDDMGNICGSPLFVARSGNPYFRLVLGAGRAEVWGYDFVAPWPHPWTKLAEIDPEELQLPTGVEGGYLGSFDGVNHFLNGCVYQLRLKKGMDTSDPGWFGGDQGDLPTDIATVANYIYPQNLTSQAPAPLRAGEVIRRLLADYLAADGVTPGEIDDGDVVAGLICDTWPVSQALDDLGRISGRAWRIDADKRLHFQPVGTEEAAFHVDTTPGAVTDALTAPQQFRCRRSGEYANKVLLRAGEQLLDPITDRFIGDGTARTCVCQFSLGATPTVTVNGVRQSVGIGGVDQAKQAYWNEGERTVTFAAAIPAGVVAEVTYRPLRPVLLSEYEPRAVVVRAAVTGDSGLYESVINAPAGLREKDALRRQLATELKTAALDGIELRYRTTRGGLRAGQVQRVTAPEFDLADERFIVTEFRTATYIDGTPYFDVTLTAGCAQRSWAEYWNRQYKLLLPEVSTEQLVEEPEVITRIDVSGTVHQAGMPVAGVRVYARYTWPDIELEEAAHTDAAGRYRLTVMLRPGQHAILQTVVGGVWQEGADIITTTPTPLVVDFDFQ